MLAKVKTFRAWTSLGKTVVFESHPYCIGIIDLQAMNSLFVEDNDAKLQEAGVALQIIFDGGRIYTVR